MADVLNITREEFEKLKRKEIGRGKDGLVLKYSNQELLKIYHVKNKELYISEHNLNDNNDMQIYVPGKISKHKSSNGSLVYFIDEGNDNFMRLASLPALEKAIDRQKYIKKTYLPQKVLYVNNKFMGCVLHRLHGVPIHKLTGVLSVKKKKLILLDILDSLNELFDNYIYHCDLSNSPYSIVNFVNEFGDFKTIKGHSHVLVNPFTLKTNLIDLDGKSTVYNEKQNKELINLALSNFAVLITEFLLKINIESNDFSDDLDETLRYEMQNLNIKREYIDMLVSRNMTIEQTEDLIKSI